MMLPARMTLPARGMGDAPQSCGFFSNTAVLDWSGFFSPSCWGSYLSGDIGPYQTTGGTVPPENSTSATVSHVGTGVLLGAAGVVALIFALKR